MKVSIIGGAGRVGSGVGYALILRDIKLSELILCDIADSVKGEAMDLQQAAAALGKKIKVSGTKDAADCQGSDLVIITAGLSLKAAGTTDRKKLLSANRKILGSVLSKLPDNGKTVYLLTTNPVDAMTYFVARKVKDRNRVIGVSTTTDTARLNTKAKGYMIGEHGGNMVHIGGSVSAKEVAKMGIDVVKSKGGTWFVTPTVVTNVAQCILKNEKKVVPVSVLLEGEYGKNTALSVPCKIGRKGVLKIKEVKLNSEQKAVLDKAATSIRKQTQ